MSVSCLSSASSTQNTPKTSSLASPLASLVQCSPRPKNKMGNQQTISNLFPPLDPSTRSETVARQALKVFNKVWSGLSKYLQAQVQGKSRCVDFPLVGRFFPQQQRCAFIPHIDFVESGRFHFPENESNISPFSKSVQVAI